VKKIIYEILSTLSTNTNIIKDKLDEILGDEKSFELLKAVFNITCDGLLKRKSKAISLG